MDVEAIERATVEAVAPARLLEIDGWLVALDEGFITRAKSAAPLRHDLGPEAIAAVEAVYRSAGLQPVFRITDVPGMGRVQAALDARGYAAAKPTLLKVGDVGRMAGFHDAPCEMLDRPDAAWGQVFLGEGFDPVEGVSRVAALSRSPDAAYGAVREDGRTVAVGVVTFGHGWAGVHGMRTAKDCRGRGLASRVLAGLGGVIRARGVDQVMLQVEAGNPARSLYRAAGFRPAWTYRYWTRG